MSTHAYLEDIKRPKLLSTPSPQLRTSALRARLMLSGVNGGKMLYYALIFLVVGLIAGALGVSGVAAIASQIAWVLFVIALVFFIIHLLSGRSRPIV